jgi:hypothetical protein
MSTSGLTFDEFASAHLDALLRFATALTNDRELGAGSRPGRATSRARALGACGFSDGSGSIRQTDDRQ